MKCEEFDKPQVICGEGVKIVLNENENEFLSLGPKFCIIDKLNEEQFEVALEECIMKLKWDSMGREDKPNKELWEVAIEAVIDDDQREDLEEFERMEYAKQRMVFDPSEGWIDMSRRRVTDVKGNSRVIFPSISKSLEFESKLEVLRIEAMDCFRTYVR